MIDLHTHVLPGIDDGPDEIDESLDLLRAAAEQGTTLMAATPHLRSDHPLVRPDELAAACEDVNARVPEGLEISVLPAGEVDLSWAQRASDEELRLASFGQRGSDLLVETPYGELTDTFEALLFNVSVRGYRVLLAHPERNPTFQRDPRRLREIAERGVLLQITLPSLLRPDKRSRSRRLAVALVEEGLAHNLASDCHSPGPWRAPALGLGLDALADHPAYAEWMVTDAPAAILAGEPLAPPETGGRPKRRLRLPGLPRRD
jgi:protein-tyrosine phosphatase